MNNYQNILIRNGFLIDENINELNLLNYLYAENYFINDYINLGLVPTFGCNFDCSYCFEKVSKKIKENIEYFAILKKYFDLELKLKKFIQLSIFGGEPLLKINEFFFIF